MNGRQWALAAVDLLMLLLVAHSAGAQVYLVPLTDPAAPTHRPEQVLDTPDLEPVSTLPADSPLRALARPVGRLRIRVRTPGDVEADAWCTGFLVAVDLLLTVHHCVPGSYGLRAEAVTFEIPQGPSTFGMYKVDPVPLETSATLDFSLLRVHGRPGDHYGWARLSRYPVRPGEAAAVVQFPRGGQEMYARRDCRVFQSSATDFIHSCDTSWGSSGAPVFSVADGTVIGLHYAGSRAANYAKQAAAIVLASPLLQALEPPGPSHAPGLDTAVARANGKMARAGEQVSARQVRESLALLARSAAQPPGSHAPASEQSALAPRPEPLIQWDDRDGSVGSTPETRPAGRPSPR